MILLMVFIDFFSPLCLSVNLRFIANLFFIFTCFPNIFPKVLIPPSLRYFVSQTAPFPRIPFSCSISLDSTQQNRLRQTYHPSKVYFVHLGFPWFFLTYEPLPKLVHISFNPNCFEFLSQKTFLGYAHQKHSFIPN